MEAGQLYRTLFCSILILSIFWNGVEAQSVPCKTPRNQSGLCVAIQRCRNIYKAVTSPTQPTEEIATHIKQAACTLPGVPRSVCCHPRMVVPEPSTTPHSRTCPVVPKENLLPRDCGISVTDRISFGNVTKVFAYPWMAVLRYEEDKVLVDRCGGSLINKRYVLTAAHCIKTRSSFRLHSIVLGEHTKGQAEDCNIYYDINHIEIERDCAEPVEVFGIESLEIHQNYDRPKYRNDIGLIRLDRDVTMKEHIKPICLPVTGELQRHVPEKYTLTGWGTTENDSVSEVLLEVNLRPVNNVECQQKMNENRMNIRLSDRQMCAGGKDKIDSCQGDSGGPLASYTIYNGVRFVQFGIVSAGVNSCGKKSVPGVYCLVASYMDWILDKIEPSC